MRYLILPVLLLGATLAGHAVQKEKLDRGLVAFKTAKGVQLSWRSLETDPEAATFDVYRDGVKVNAEPLRKGTNYIDAAGSASSHYTVKGSATGWNEESKSVDVWDNFYKRIHLDRPASGISAPGGHEQMSDTDYEYTYTPNDMSVGDVDGDGEYELFVKWDPSNQADNSQRRNTGNVIIDCYKLDGTKLWRIDLGQNIRAGAHYTQFMVYDFDGDGKAEMICKTAPGTIDGNGKAVLMGSDKVTDDYRVKSGTNTGIIKSGSEYLTVFDGLTGAEINTVSYVPLRSVATESAWGDSYANRSERYLACVAYLDGEKPSAVFCRGYYTMSYLCAWDFDGKKLTQRWLHASETKGKGAYGEGAHSLTVGDVDGDGCDEIVYGSSCIDHDGSLLYRTGFGHGDALHLGDFDPDREGLEVFMVHEEKGSAYPWDCEFRDAKTGKVIWGEKQSGNDIGRGLVGNLSETYRGYECWPGSRYVNGTRVNATFDCKGNVVTDGKVPSSCFRIYWDGDLNDELFDGKYNSDAAKAYPVIEKRSNDLSSSTTLVSFNQYGGQSCNTTKATPCLSADILGDWREEIILWDYANPGDILLFTTDIPSNYRIPCLMQDHNYRMAIAWQNVAYNQPPHLGYYLADLSTDPIIVVNSTTSQTVEMGSPMIPIVGSWKNTDVIECKGLPAGINFVPDYENKTFSIEGAPTEKGGFGYSVTAVGDGVNAQVTGIIKVVDAANLTTVAHYPFEAIVKINDKDHTPNVITGTHAVAVGSHGTVSGMVGNAAMFNGSDQYVEQSHYDNISIGKQDLTIELWINSQATAGYIFQKGGTANNGTTSNGNWIGLEYKNSLLRFAVDDDVVKSETVVSASSCFDGKWHHIVCVRDVSAKVLRLFVDGVLANEASDNTGAVIDMNEPLIIGQCSALNNGFAGMIDEFIVHQGAMTAAGVASRYGRVLAGASGIEGANVGDAETLSWRVIDLAGTQVAYGNGDASAAAEGLGNGVFVLIETTAKGLKVTKIVK